MGGSAQVTVLAVELIRLALEDEVDVLEHSLLAHRDAQAGRGSGADVAAVFTGDVIRYRASPRELVGISPLRAHLSYVHSGQSARTSEIVAAVEQRVPPKARARIVSDADALGEAMERALFNGDFGSLKRSLADQEALLSTLDVETEAIRQILSLVARCGCAGKISGAGLGDGCVLFSPDSDAEASMLTALRSRGFWATEVQIEPGLRSETPREELAWLFEA
jgi:phosphomevalonate kinase